MYRGLNSVTSKLRSLETSESAVGLRAGASCRTVELEGRGFTRGRKVVGEEGRYFQQGEQHGQKLRG